MRAAAVIAAVRRIGVLAVIAAGLCLVGGPASGLANAQGPGDSQAETSTRLVPGVNFVGWVGETTPVSQLFREIPSLEAVWAWDSELRVWIVAGRDAPESLGGLERVRPGMGLRLQLGGEDGFVWRRSTAPTRGLVPLRAGWNLVAWSGPDHAPMQQLADGIGWSLVSIRRWSAADQRYTAWRRAAGGGGPATLGVRRGEALWVEVSRSVNWLQPAGIVPRLVFPGGAEADVRRAAESLVVSLLAYFRDAFGIEADGSSYEIWMPSSGEALREAALEIGVDRERADGLIQQWNSAIGWVDSFRPGEQALILRQPSPEWESWGLLAHEYFHVVQLQLSADGAPPPVWLGEGAAVWAEVEYLVAWGDETRGELEEEYRHYARGAPPLREVEQGLSGWPYLLGWLAVERLNDRAGADAWIEFWRRAAPSAIGPDGRWSSSLAWDDAFEDVFGISAADFYVDFDGSIGELDDVEQPTRYVRGRVVGASGAPIGRLTVRAARVEWDVNVEWSGPAVTGPDGRFAVAVVGEGAYRLSLDVDDDCRRYYANGGATAQYGDAELVEVGAPGVSEVAIRLRSDVCGWDIRGTVVDVGGEPLAGLSVSACEVITYDCTADERTGLDGSFAVTTAVPGQYRLRLDLVGGCSVYYGSGGAALDRAGATLIVVSEADVSGIALRVPRDVCAQRISGRLAQADGQPLSEVYVSACRAADGDCVASDGTRDDGSFALAVPTDGAYRLSFDLNGCSVYFDAGGVSTNPGGDSAIRVAGRDVRLGLRQIPAGMCAWQIRGSIATADGQPLAYTYVSACQEVGGQCVAWAGQHTDSEGAFAITAPAAGEYRLSFEFEGCEIHFRAGGLTSDWRERSTVSVVGRDARLELQRIPESVCAQQIIGRIVDVHGAPVGNRWMSVCRADACGNVQTAADGRFAIRVSSDGAYVFKVWLRDDCDHRLKGEALGSPGNPVRVRGAGATEVELRLPGTIERLCG